MQLQSLLFVTLMTSAPLFAATAAHGDEPSPAAPAPAPAPPPPPTPPPHNGVYWHDEWPRFSLLEGMVSVAVTARNADLGAALDGPTSATIKFQVPLLDDGVRSLLRGGNPSVRAGAAKMSDTLFRAMVFAPYVFDVGLGALILNRNPDVALQLALIDFEVLTLAGLTQLLSSRVIGRARPYVDGDTCGPGGCSGGPFRSFMSGHSMATFTAAGLMCQHHQNLPLFGGGAIDQWACIWAVTAASLTGTMRIVADEHWTSDVIIGGATGWMFGYFLPRLLHFHTKKMTATTADGKPRAFTWMPTLTGTTEAGMLGVAGTF